MPHPATLDWMESENRKVDLKPRKAHCLSQICTRLESDVPGVEAKDVPRGTVWCPDCGHALFWCTTDNPLVAKGSRGRVQKSSIYYKGFNNGHRSVYSRGDGETT